MQAVIVADKDKADWDRFVESNSGVISWHIYDWYKVYKGSYGLDYYPLAVHDGKKIRGILPLYHVRTHRTGSALISIPYVVAGGIVAVGDDVQKLLLERAIDLSRQMGSIPIILKQYKVRVDGDLITDAGYYNRELSLSPNIEDVWHQISEENQGQIKATEQENLTLEYPSQDLNGFFRALLKRHQIEGVPCPSKGWVRQLMITGLYVIALLKRGDSVVAGTMAKTFKDTVSFPLTCLPSREERREVYGYRLYWDLLSSLAEQGIRIAHSGRIPDSEEVPRYRLGWGGEKHRYYYQYYAYSGKDRIDEQTREGPGHPQDGLDEDADRSLPTGRAYHCQAVPLTGIGIFEIALLCEATERAISCKHSGLSSSLIRDG